MQAAVDTLEHWIPGGGRSTPSTCCRRRAGVPRRPQPGAARAHRELRERRSMTGAPVVGTARGGTAAESQWTTRTDPTAASWRADRRDLPGRSGEARSPDACSTDDDVRPVPGDAAQRRPVVNKRPASARASRPPPSGQCGCRSRVAARRFGQPRRRQSGAPRRDERPLRSPAGQLSQAGGRRR